MSSFFLKISHFQVLIPFAFRPPFRSRTYVGNPIHAGVIMQTTTANVFENFQKNYDMPIFLAV